MREFEWDENKSRANLLKHNISFNEAITVFKNKESVVYKYKSKIVGGETRYLSLGLYKKSTVIAVVHTVRRNKIRIISARPASRRERTIYEKKIG